MAMQCTGSGGEDAHKIMGFLGIPGGDTMKHQHFHDIKDLIGDTEQNIGTLAIEDALQEEIQLTLERERFIDQEGDTYEEWIQKPHALCEPVTLIVLFDAGWQKRGSGHIYDSLSGHVAFIGQLSKKMIALAVSCKSLWPCSIFPSLLNKSGTVMYNMTHEYLI